MVNDETMDSKEKIGHTERGVDITSRSDMPHATQFNYHTMSRALSSTITKYHIKEDVALPSEVMERLLEMEDALIESIRPEGKEEELSHVKVAILTLTDTLNTFEKHEIEPFLVLKYMKRDLPLAQYNLEHDIPPQGQSSGGPGR